MVDYLLTLATAIITLSAIVLGSFLLRYRQLVKEFDVSSRLAKDVWDSVNSRFSVMDARLIDIMAKTEVLYSRAGSPAAISQPTSATPLPASRASQPTSQTPVSTAPTPAAPQATPATVMPTAASPRSETRTKRETRAEAESTETERKILQFLSQGPKTSNQIIGEVTLTREHTGRLLKSLFGRGLVTRNAANKPYVYELTEDGSTVTS